MKTDRTRLVGTYAATLTSVEVGLGSLLHSFHVPFAGHFLAINQTSLLCRLAVLTRNKKAVMEVSVAASLLKSLSPSGKKLTPMLAISAQGLLFSMSIALLGINIIGLFIAIVLSSLWAYVQPLIILYFLFGKNLLEVINHFFKEFSQYVPHLDEIIIWVALGMILLKILIALIISYLAVRISQPEFEQLQKQLVHFHKPNKEQQNLHPFVGALKDLLNPLFIFSIGFTFIFFYYSQSSKTELIWALLRPLTLGYGIFLFVRIYPMRQVTEKLKQKGWNQLAHTIEIALAKIRDDRES